MFTMQEREERADVHELGDLAERHERGQDRRSSTPNSSVVSAPASGAGSGVAKTARQQPVAAHREDDARLAVEDRQQRRS